MPPPPTHRLLAACVLPALNVHRSILNKYLLLSAIALTALVFDAFIGHSGPKQKPASIANPPEAPAPAKNIMQSGLAETRTSLNQPTPATRMDTPSEPSESEALAQKLHAIEADYSALSQPILEKSPPIIAADDRAKLAYLDQEKLKDMGTVLSTSELEVYQNQIDLASAPKRR